MIRSVPALIALALPSLVGCAPCDDFAVVEGTSVDVGSVGVGQSGQLDLTLTSTCAAPVAIEAFMSGRAFSVSPASTTASADADGTLTIVFEPQEQSEESGTLALESEGGTTLGVSVSGTAIPWVDDDGDGFSSDRVGGDDCNDADPDINPDAEEIWYDGVDQDCDGASDFDQDGDGVDTPEDCDDTDATVLPGAAEGEDGLDNDCDGLIDEGSLGVDDILITEVMHSPEAVDDGVGEWFEIHNQGSEALQLQGYRVGDADGAFGFEIDRGVLLDAGGYVVLAVDGRASNNGGVPVDFVYNRENLRLREPEGGITLLGAKGRVISRVAWVEGWPNLRGRTLQLDPAASTEADLAERGLWCHGSEPMTGGDLGTPKAANTACPRFDADEDGFAIQDGDCDDTDPDINPDADEVWGDGVDNDCDGLKDQGSLSTFSTARITGASSPNLEALGYPDALSLGDVDGDGSDEVLLGARFGAGYSGAVYVLEAGDLRTGSAASLATATFTGGSTTNQLGMLAPFTGDVTGDGVHDLVIGGTDARDSDDVAAVVLAGGSGLSAALGPGDAVLSLTGVTTTTGGDVHGGLDLDGDGRAELVHGDVGHSDRTGRVTVVLGGTTGTVDAADADHAWTGSARQDHAGHALGGGDLDDDGYDDLLVAAWGDDSEASNGGAVYLIAGGSAPPADGTLAEHATASLHGDSMGARLGEGAAARVADLDGDGDLDVLVGAPLEDRAYVWLGAGTLSGVNLVSDADHRLEGPGSPDSFGVGLATSDVDGDGLPEAIVGAADDMTATTDLATSAGEVWVFDLDGAPTVLGPGEARAVVRGATVGDAVGQSLLGLDLDGDGTGELLVGATGEAGGAGVIHLVEL